MIEIKIEVQGMKCGMCESHVSDAVRRLDGIKKVSSSRSKNQTVVVAEDNINQEEIVNAIKSQGYTVGRTVEKPYVKRGLFGGKKG